MGLRYVHAEIHRLLQRKYGPYFWTEAHAVLPQKDSKGNSEFEG